MDLLPVLRRLRIENGLHLVQCLYALATNHEPYEFFQSNPKNAPFMIKLHAILAEDFECPLQIRWVAIVLYAFDYHVVYVHFHICPDEGLEDVFH